MRARGRMLPFNEEQIAAIRANLAEPDRAPRDFAIFETWLHNCLSRFRLPLAYGRRRSGDEWRDPLPHRHRSA